MTEAQDRQRKCEFCGAALSGKDVACSSCGNATDISALLPQQEQQSETSALPGKKTGTKKKIAYTILAALALLLFLAIAAAYGIYSGLQERERLELQTLAEHYQRGLDSMNAGDYALAVAEFEYVERIRPGYRDCAELLQQAQAALLSQPTPTSQAREDIAGSLFARAQDEMEREDWSAAIATLQELQELMPDYKAEQVKALLYQNMYSAGTEAVHDHDVTVGLEWFKQALEINPGSDDTRRQIAMANSYLAALDYWDHDWEVTIDRLQMLYSLSPDYADTSERLATAYSRYGDQLSSSGEWCQAAKQYEQSASMKSTSVVEIKADLARQNCESPPTETPEPATEATSSPYDAASGLVPLPGSGTLYFAMQDPNTDKTAIFTLRGTEVKLLVFDATQPAVRSDGYFAYHNLVSDRLGISLAQPNGTFTSTIANHPEDVWPTWEPGDGRLAFATTREGDRKWRIYISENWHAGGEGKAIAFGKSPDWGPNGTIAYRGCDQSGNKCGIYVMGPDGTLLGQVSDNPNDEAPSWSPDGKRIAFVSPRSGTNSIWIKDLSGGQPVRLTDDTGLDAAPVWSPDGEYIAFISNRDGSWAIWVVSASGGTPQKIQELGQQLPGNWDEMHMDWR